MPMFIVTLPIAGTVSTEIEAKDAEEAIEKALNDEDGPFNDNDIMREGWYLDELETYRSLGEGNVSHVSHDEAVAVEQDDDVDDSLDSTTE